MFVLFQKENEPFKRPFMWALTFWIVYNYTIHHMYEHNSNFSI